MVWYARCSCAAAKEHKNSTPLLFFFLPGRNPCWLHHPAGQVLSSTGYVNHLRSTAVFLKKEQVAKLRVQRIQQRAKEEELLAQSFYYPTSQQRKELRIHGKVRREDGIGDALHPASSSCESQPSASAAALDGKGKEKEKTQKSAAKPHAHATYLPWDERRPQWNPTRRFSFLCLTPYLIFAHARG